MLATAITLAVIGLAVSGLADLARQDGAKIRAAQQGRSWRAEARTVRPVIVRFNSPRKAAQPVWPVLRAAA